MRVLHSERCTSFSWMGSKIKENYKNKVIFISKFHKDLKNLLNISEFTLIVPLIRN